MRLADSQHLVLRWCDPRDWGDLGKEHLRRETLASQLLRGSVLPVPQLLAADIDGTHAGGPASLVTWLPGAVRLDPLRAGAIEALAEVLVVLHRNHAADGQRPPEFSHRGPAQLVVPAWTTRPLLWQRAIDLRAADGASICEFSAAAPIRGFPGKRTQHKRPGRSTCTS